MFSNSEQKKNIIEEMKDDMRKESENLIVGEIGLIGKYILRSYIFFFCKDKKRIEDIGYRKKIYFSNNTFSCNL